MDFEDTVLKSYPTGSRYICHPPVMDTDNDTVILANGYYDWVTMLLKDGWEDCGQYNQGGDFRAFRKGQENYIVTERDDFFQSYVLATSAAKALNLREKAQRILLFEVILRKDEEGFEGFAKLEGYGLFGGARINHRPKPEVPEEERPEDIAPVREYNDFEYEDPFIGDDDVRVYRPDADYPRAAPAPRLDPFVRYEDYAMPVRMIGAD